MLANVALFVALAIAGGLGSSWYMIEKGSPLTTRKDGPWVAWTAAGRADADPYTRAHFARRGVLPVSSTLLLAFEARTDDEGRVLQSRCEYAIEGDEPGGAWWSLALYDDAGGLIENAAGRYTYNSATVMRDPGGPFTITLAPSVRPGNWLPSGSSERLTVVLAVEEPEAAGALPGDFSAVPLPQIRRVACR